MNKKFYVFLILIALIILPSLIRGAQEAPIPAASLVLDVSESWVPKKDNFIIVTVTLPSRAVHPGGSVTFSLLSSSWPGYCMNAYFGNDFDSDPKNTAPDMSFIPANQPDIIGCTWNPSRTSTEKVQDIILQFGNNAENLPGSVALRIESYDYGAIAKLHVAISYNDEIQVQNSAMIPVDDDCNYIADYWQKNAWAESIRDPDFIGPLPAPTEWTGTATDDLESGPAANMFIGDGITAVEEWRGFILGGGHQRTDPRKKDIFLFADTQLRKYGWAWADQLPSIFTRRTVNANEMQNVVDDGNPDTSKNTAINFLVCDGLHRITQRAIWLNYDSTHNDSNDHVGKTQFLTAYPMHGPSRVKQIDVYGAEIKETVDEVYRNVNNYTWKETTKNKVYNWTIGHEIGHALYLPHVRDVSSNQVEFHWGGNENRTDTVTLSGTIEETIMRANVRIGAPTQFNNYNAPVHKYGYPGYHDTTYRLVPDDIYDIDKRVYKTSVMPDFKAWPATNVLQDTTHNSPDTPIDLSASYGDGYVSLSWTAASGTVTDYQYRYRVSGGSWSSWISAGLVTLFDVLGLTNGTTYEFEVRAMNGQQASAAIASSFGVTPATVPGAPTIWRADSGDGQVNLSWTVPSDDGGSEITDYEYQYRESNGGTWRLWTSFRVISTSEDVAGLTNGTEYEFRVRAVNRVGGGSESNTLTATPLLPPPPIVLRPPTAPTDLSASYGDGQISLSWTAPSSSGSSTITHYEYRYATGRSSNHSAFTDWESTDSTDTSYVVTGLTNGTQHLLQVRAVNSERASSASNTAFQTPLAPAVAPESPTDLSASYGDGQITLSWTAPSSSGSSAITHYEYRYATGHYPNHSAFTDWTSTGSTSTTYVVTGLTNGTQYLLQVRAVNSERASSASNTAFQTPLAPASAPIWSDIPDPYSLTVGDSFSLDLNSYVTGSPTITKTLGTIPAGLSLSGGVVSGTVTTVEDRSIQFTATNSAGYALSEWVNIVVQAAQ